MSQASGGSKKAISKAIGKAAKTTKNAAAKATGVALFQARKAGGGVAKSTNFIYSSAKEAVKATPAAAKNLAKQPVATVKAAASGVKTQSVKHTVGLKDMRRQDGILKTVTSAGAMATGAGIVMAASYAAGDVPAKGEVRTAKKTKKAAKPSDFEKAARSVEED